MSDLLTKAFDELNVLTNKTLFKVTIMNANIVISQAMKFRIN